MRTGSRTASAGCCDSTPPKSMPWAPRRKRITGSWMWISAVGCRKPLSAERDRAGVAQPGEASQLRGIELHPQRPAHAQAQQFRGGDAHPGAIEVLQQAPGWNRLQQRVVAFAEVIDEFGFGQHAVEVE